MHAHFELTTERPPDEVFAYLADLRNMPDWYMSIDSAELVAGQPGEVGARFKVVNDRKLLDDLVFDYQTTSVEPGRELVFSIDHPKMVGTETYLLEAAGGGTRVTFDSDADYTKLNKLLTPVGAATLKAVQGPVRRSLQTALDGAAAT